MKYPIRGGVIGAVVGFVGLFAASAIGNAIAGAPPFLLLHDLLDDPRWWPFVLLIAGIWAAVCAVIGFVVGFLWWAWIEFRRR